MIPSSELDTERINRAGYAQELLELLRTAPAEDQQVIRSEVEAALKYSQAGQPSKFFPYHAQQKKALGSDADVIAMIGGNRSGKSTGARGILGEVVHRTSPINKRLQLDTRTGLRTRDLWRPLTIWVATPTSEKFRTDWIDPAEYESSVEYWLGDQFREHKSHPDEIFRTKADDLIVMKSYDQGFKSFESSAVDLVICDEEPLDPRILTSIFMRLADSNGVLVLAYTPLDGLTHLYHKFYKPLIEKKRAVKVSDREWIGREGGEGRLVHVVQMGTADNPKAARSVKSIEHDTTMTEAEKEARLYGKYGFARGVHLPRLAGMDLLEPSPEHKPYVIDKILDFVSVYIIADPNWRWGSILAGIDGDGNRQIVYQHAAEGESSRKHADVFKKWRRDFPSAQLFHDPGGAGKLAATELAELGLYFTHVDKPAGSVARSIGVLKSWTIPDPNHAHPITGKLGAPKLYFYRPGLLEYYEEDGEQHHGSRLIEQLGSAKQPDDEFKVKPAMHKTQKESYDLFDVTRYLALLTHAAGDRRGEDDDRVSRRPLATVQERLPTSREIARQRAQERRSFDPLGVDLPDPYDLEEAVA